LPQIWAGAASEEGASNIAVGVAVTLALDQPQADHRVRNDFECAGRNFGHLGELDDSRRARRKAFEQTDFAGHKRCFAAMKPIAIFMIGSGAISAMGNSCAMGINCDELQRYERP
jgi:hypothetical protein